MDEARLRSHKLTNLLHSLLLLGGMALLLGTLGWVVAGPQGLLWTILLGTVLLAVSPRLTPRMLLKLYHAQRLTRRTAMRALVVNYLHRFPVSKVGPPGFRAPGGPYVCTAR